MRAATAANGTRRGPVWARSGAPEQAASGTRRGRVWARSGAPEQAGADTTGLLVVGLWLLTRAVLLVVSLNPRLYSAALFGDVRFYGAKVERMFQGELPYRDVATEYPPGSVPFTILPALVVGTGAGYRLAFACEMLLVDAAGLWAATRLGRVIDAGRRRIPLAYVLAMVAVGPLLVLRFDLVPAVCVLVAVAMAAEGRFGWAAAFLGYGTAAKLFPAVLAPLLVLGMVPALGWWRSFRRTVPPFLAGFGLTVVPALLLSARGTLDSALYHVQRGVQIESLWANLIGIAHLFGLPAQTVYGFGAYDLSSSVSGIFKALSGVVTLAGLAAAAWLVWRRARASGGLGPADWAGAFTLGTFAFVLPTRVLSPQYLVWLCAPMVGLAAVLAGRRALWALVAAAVVSQVIFPFRYTQLRRLYPFDIGLLTLRNLLLILACALVVQAFNRRPADRQGAVETAG
ncbi:MAG TPA: glycosyltransferase family 87 protein [Actinomycetes bacterium]|nr:glycosyltransferase family 87 protein [Actinomycetes bacterium]